MAEAEKKKRLRKSETMRDKTLKASEEKPKKRRIRKTAGAVTKPIKTAASVGKKEYHIIPQSDKGIKGFLTKSRRWTPAYFRSAFQELKLVTWPNRRETWRLMFAVFIFAAVFGLAVTLIDYGLDKLFRRIFL